MRAFRVRRASAVETALRSIRSTLGGGWSMVSADDNTLLEWVLGELWAFSDRATWDGFRFSALDPDDVFAAIALARRLKESDHAMVKGLESLAELIRAAGTRGAAPDQSD